MADDQVEGFPTVTPSSMWNIRGLRVRALLAGLALFALFAAHACDTTQPDIGTVAGSVSVEGSPLAGIEVRLVGDTVDARTTDSAGAYRFEAASGTYAVEIVSHPADAAFAATSQTVAITRGQVQTLIFQGSWIRTSIISGHVTSDLGPQEGMRVSASEPSNADGQTDAGRLFTLTGGRRVGQAGRFAHRGPRAEAQPRPPPCAVRWSRQPGSVLSVFRRLHRIGGIRRDVGRAALAVDVQGSHGTATPIGSATYTHSGILGFREASGTPPAAPRREGTGPGLLIWGRITARGAVIEPAFEVDAPPLLPRASDPYRLRGLDDQGRELISLPFQGADLPAEAGGGRHFAMVLPLDRADREALRTLELEGPSIRTARAGPGLAGSRSAQGRARRRFDRGWSDDDQVGRRTIPHGVGAGRGDGTGRLVREGR